MTFIGQSTRRAEDARFLTGRGTFVDDVNVPGQLYAYVVRSPHAHAVIERIDTGGGLVFTYKDITDLGLMPCATAVATVGPMIVPPRSALAIGKVRHVGDPVAFVVAETPAAARDAAERVVVEYRPLPSVVDSAAALTTDAPRLWDQGNLSFRFQKGDPDAVRAGLAQAAHVVELELINNRLIIAPTETRAAIGRFEHGSFHLFASVASVHALRDQLAGVFGVPTEQLTVSAPDVGG
ncbi:MAG TPA: molybdopterin cofactor-binding domain-containing protein, partial [Acetobacteraceae bacterium]|nr:molybdopterin cofactor-binding domain-containing protein [Acetobacteraceae bacterium]